MRTVTTKMDLQVGGYIEINMEYYDNEVASMAADARQTASEIVEEEDGWG